MTTATEEYVFAKLIDDLPKMKAPTGLFIDWIEFGLCAQADPEAFFVGKGGSVREAKSLCASCEVRPQCLEWALATNQPTGVWGGLSANERKVVRKQRQEAGEEVARFIPKQLAMPEFAPAPERTEIARLDEPPIRPVVLARPKARERVLAAVPPLPEPAVEPTVLPVGANYSGAYDNFAHLARTAPSADGRAYWQTKCRELECLSAASAA